MTTAPNPAAPAGAQQGSNGLGVAGFIVSLVGILTCGILSPLGLLFSLLGLFKKPRGMAIAGFVLGILGTAFLVLAGYGIVAGFIWGRGVAYTGATTISMSEAARQIEQYHAQNNAYPTGEQADQLIGNVEDAWGNAVVYTLVSDDAYTLAAPGEDGELNTDDDITYDSQTDTFATPQGDIRRGQIRERFDDVVNEAAQKAAEEAARQQGVPVDGAGDPSPQPQ